MVRISPAVRAITLFLLLVSTTGGGWMAACTRPAAANAQPSHDPARHAMHGGMHHPAPAHRPAAPAPGAQQPECPVLAMSGGGCTATADAATLDLALPRMLAATDAYPPAAGVHDRLLSDAFFRPPRLLPVPS
ncbi:MAG TPA: hypothetical protein VGO40_03305 [Longimicrobium sp.]|jgi:hypothetical protein|nr:hypothetical protein [Longimicrobium sp.]